MVDIPLIQPGTGKELVFHSIESAADARRRGYTDPNPVPAEPVAQPAPRKRRKPRG